MDKDEILEVREYHFRKIKNLLEIYVDKEIDYKNHRVSDSRLLKLNELITELNCERKRINEIDYMLVVTCQKQDKMI